MDSKFKTDEINPCKCGFKPDHYIVMYGRTPYDIWCPTCKKQTCMAKCKVTGSSENAIDYWNSHIAQMTKEEVRQEVVDFQKERENQNLIERPKEYQYYWEKDKGEVLYERY